MHMGQLGKSIYARSDLSYWNRDLLLHIPPDENLPAMTYIPTCDESDDHWQSSFTETRSPCGSRSNGEAATVYGSRSSEIWRNSRDQNENIRDWRDNMALDQELSDTLDLIREAVQKMGAGLSKPSSVLTTAPTPPSRDAEKTTVYHCTAVDKNPLYTHSDVNKTLRYPYSVMDKMAVNPRGNMDKIPVYSCGSGVSNTRCTYSGVNKTSVYPCSVMDKMAVNHRGNMDKILVYSCGSGVSKTLCTYSGVNKTSVYPCSDMDRSAVNPSGVMTKTSVYYYSGVNNTPVYPYSVLDMTPDYPTYDVDNTPDTTNYGSSLYANGLKGIINTLEITTIAFGLLLLMVTVATLTILLLYFVP